jgi:transcriptional regulator with PAS, ATPase and Fis domain
MTAHCVDQGGAGDLIGEGPWMQALRRDLRRLAACDVSVLLEGESGTGKELIARRIHRCGRRARGPFIGVNCAAIHETLLESELFGHEAGAFTGAGQATVGFLRAADGGTILLDEVGDMSPSLQCKLLRVLEERAVVPVGGTQAIGIDVRVIAATNRDLGCAVERGEFRRDLYYRLNVVRLKILPLRERPGDIPLIARRILEQTAEALDAPLKRISPEAMRALMHHDWPGNVRELGNVIQRAYVLGRGETIVPEDLPEEVTRCRPSGRGQFPTLREAVRRHVERALAASDGVRSEAARLLGIDRKSLWRMMRRYETPTR